METQSQLAIQGGKRREDDMTRINRGIGNHCERNMSGRRKGGHPKEKSEKSEEKKRVEREWQGVRSEEIIMTNTRNQSDQSRGGQT